MRGPQRGSEGRDGDRKPYAVLDIETDGLRGPLLYWTAGCECAGSPVHTGTTAEGLWDTILRGGGPGHGTQGGWSRDHRSRDHVWWGHNAGEYDYLYLFEAIKAEARRPSVQIIPVVRTDQMIGFRVNSSKHRTDLRDSFALLPSRLGDLAEQLAPELPKLDIGLAEGVTFDPARADHREYAERDTVALLAVLTRFRALLGEGFDGALPSWSAASTALRAWTRTLGETERYSQAPHEGGELARAGYYGGMVHLGSTAWHQDATTLDVNAMYAAAMRQGVPDGWAWPVRRYVPGRPGFYLVTAHVPRGMPFTFIPYRDPAGMLAWPTGTFQTVIDSATLDAGRARGIRFEVHAGEVWAELSRPFEAFIDRVEVLEGRGGAMKYVAKIMRNSLYGKFGSRPTRDDWQISAARPGPDYWPPADGSIEGLWVRRGAPLRAPYLMPHWAAWITAQARLRLLELVEAVGAADVIYTDTDSVTAPTELVDAAIAAGRVTVGRQFGAVKIEHRFSRYRALAPKVTQGVETDGTSILRAKGIPRRQVAAAFDGGEVGWASGNGAIQVLQGAPMTTWRTRHLSSLAGSVAWRAAPDGAVVPVNLPQEPDPIIPRSPFAAPRHHQGSKPARAAERKARAARVQHRVGSDAWYKSRQSPLSGLSDRRPHRPRYATEADELDALEEYYRQLAEPLDTAEPPPHPDPAHPEYRRGPTSGGSAPTAGGLE